MISAEFLRYSVAGLIAFAFDFATLYLATEHLSLHYLLSNVLGYSIGLCVSYYLNIKWVFIHRRFGQKSSLEFAIFNIIVIVGLGLSELSLFLLAEYGQMHYLMAKVFSAASVVLFNYLCKKFILFRPRSVERIS